MEEISAFKFPARCHFMTSLHCPIISNKRTSAFQQKRQRSDIMKSKMAVHKKFDSRNLFRLLLFLNVIFPLSSKFVIKALFGAT